MSELSDKLAELRELAETGEGGSDLNFMCETLERVLDALELALYALEHPAADEYGNVPPEARNAVEADVWWEWRNRIHAAILHILRGDTE